MQVDGQGQNGMTDEQRQQQQQQLAQKWGYMNAHGVLTPGESFIHLNLYGVPDHSRVLVTSTHVPRDTGADRRVAVAPSGEMYPQLRGDLITPMQLDMLARGERIEGHPDVSLQTLSTEKLEVKI